MTADEFKAWLEIYEVPFSDSAPSPEQWANIKAKLSTVGTPARTGKPLPPYPAPGDPYPPIQFD